METVSGKVIINLNKARKFEHKGIKLELMGIIQGTKDLKDTLKFISLTQDLETIGMLTTEVNTYPFKFMNVQKQFETYRGVGKNVKYLLRLTIEAKLKTLTYDQEFAVINPEPPAVLETDNKPIKLEVGIEDWLHLVFDVDSRNFGLKDVAKGRVTFKKVSIRLKSMEVDDMPNESGYTFLKWNKKYGGAAVFVVKRNSDNKQSLFSPGRVGDVTWVDKDLAAVKTDRDDFGNEQVTNLEDVVF